MSFASAARVVLVAAACAAAAGSATSGSTTAPTSEPGQSTAPPPQQMDPTRALGLWHSEFGAVKIEADQAHGGLANGSIHGVWLYRRKGQNVDVVGYFGGTLLGTALGEEPAQQRAATVREHAAHLCQPRRHVAGHDEARPQ